MCSELTPGTDVMAVKTAENVSLKSLVTGWTGQDRTGLRQPSHKGLPGPTQGLGPWRQAAMTDLLKQVLWDLCGLPRASLAFDDEDLVTGNGGQELLSEGEHGQAAADGLDGFFLLGLG